MNTGSVSTGVNLISAKELSKTLGDTQLFSEITFGIHAGDKTAFIGPNGCGKSTLMKIIASKMETDSGEISYNNDLRLAYLPQVPDYDPEVTVLEHILEGGSPLVRTVRSYEGCLSRMQQTPPSDRTALQNLKGELDALTLKMDEIGGWDLEHKISAVLQQLGIDFLDARMGILSGGMVKKVEIGRALLGDCNAIILDEPTNHLDLDTIEWLENFLIDTAAAVILITHDRYFLDNVCNRIFEMDSGELFEYEGNYSVYMKKRAERLDARERRQKKMESILRSELAWLRQGPKARTSKDRKRTERVYDLMDSQDSQKASAMEFSVTNRRLGKKILEIKNISKSFGQNTLIKAFSYSFKKGIRIGIVGPNGSGKTTFLKMILGREEMDGGRIDIGKNTSFGYFDQLSEEMDQNQTVMGYLREYAHEIRRAGGGSVDVKQLLEEFQFPPGRQHSKIAYLSGGERRRLYLLKILLPSPNFLLFDEPTNDLDIQTLSLLESFLMNYDGCVMTVSHDRYFLDRTVDFLFIFDGKGDVSGFPGSYSDYVEYKKEVERERMARRREEKTDTRVRHNDSGEKLSFKEQRELESLLPKIELLEERRTQLEEFFLNPDPSALEKTQKEYNQVLREIEEKTARWEELASRA